MSNPNSFFVLDGLTNKDLKLLKQYRIQQSSNQRGGRSFAGRGRGWRQTPTAEWDRPNLPSIGRGSPTGAMSRNFCTVCEVSIFCPKDWDSHLQGKKHQGQLNLKHAVQMSKPQEVTTNRRERFCSTCSVTMHDRQSYNEHMNGKKHKLISESREKLDRGVYVSGFPCRLPSEELRHYFGTFGELADFIYFPERNYVLLEYKHRQSAKNLLKMPIQICGKRVNVLPRQYREARTASNEKIPQSPPECDVKHDEVVKILTNGADLGRLIHALELEPECEKDFRALCRDLETVFRTDYPRCVAIPFGSTVTGLALKGSDIDVFLNLHDPAASRANTRNSEGPQSGPKPPDPYVVAGRKLMLKYRQFFSYIVPVARAKTPIIKFNHRPTKTKCDVSFKNAYGVSNSELIRFYISLDPRIRPFLMILKYWGKVHSLSGTGKMSNYALILKALFYLMQLEKPVIPPVAELQVHFTEKDLAEEGWLCKFSNDKSSIKPTENKSSVYQLLHGFFQYYGEFDYGGNVICPRIGKVVPKSSFAMPDLLPDSLRLYKEKKVPRELKFSSEMCVQDPFELTHNPTAMLGAKSVTLFCSYCQIAAKALEGAMKDDSKWGLGLIQVLDVNLKPANRKYVNLNKSSMKLNINVGQYLSLAYAMDEGCEAANSDPEIVRKIKIYKWVRLVHELVMKIMQVMKFSVTEQSDDESSSKVQKLEEFSDVHLNTNGTVFGTKEFRCQSVCNVWDGRRRVLKTLKFPDDIYPLKMEELISDVLMAGRDKEAENAQVKFKCTFEPKVDPIQVALTFMNDGSQTNAFFPAMSFLQTRLPIWIEKTMSWYMKNHLLQQTGRQVSNTSITDSVASADSSEASESTSEANLVESLPSDTTDAAMLESHSAADSSEASESTSEANLVEPMPSDTTDAATSESSSAADNCKATETTSEVNLVESLPSNLSTAADGVTG